VLLGPKRPAESSFIPLRPEHAWGDEGQGSEHSFFVPASGEIGASEKGGFSSWQQGGQRKGSLPKTAGTSLAAEVVEATAALGESTSA